MLSLFAQCQFCENIASTSRDILCNERGESVVRATPVCEWHESFFGWMYTTLGQSAKARMQLHEIKEGKPWS